MAKITPDQIANSGTEHGEQAALFMWAQANFGNDPRLRLLFAIPNGGARGDDQRARMIRGANMKAEGVKPGVPDVCLPVPSLRWGYDAYVMQEQHLFRNWYHGLFIEMKKPAAKLKRGPNGSGPWDNGGVDPEQKVWLDALTEQGYKCAVCYSWLEAANVIKIYLTGSGLE